MRDVVEIVDVYADEAGKSQAIDWGRSRAQVVIVETQSVDFDREKRRGFTVGSPVVEPLEEGP